MALLLTGAVGGWFLRGWVPDGGVQDRGPAIVRPIRVVEDRARLRGAVPSVLRLGVAEARQALSDADLDPGRVRAEPTAFAGEAGLVVGQDPPPGEKARRGPIVLRVSTRAAMPGLVGQSFDAARKRLTTLGATVSTTRRYAAGTKEDQVLRTRPAAGALLAEDVALVLAEAASSVFLTDLELRAEVGLADDSDAGARVRFEIVADERVVAAVTAGIGRPRPLRATVTGALRVSLRAQRLDEGTEEAQAVFADPQLRGGRAAIDELTGG